MIAINSVSSRTQLEVIERLFRDYAGSLGFDLEFQNFDRELSTLPGEYAPPGGDLLLAEADGSAVGCVALRRISNDACEMKRLYVKPGFRGRGAGRMLVTSIIDSARRLGYHRMLLDTIETMNEAIGLYYSFGFRETAPYRHNPIPGARFFELRL